MSFFSKPNKEQAPVQEVQAAQPAPAGFFKSWKYAWDEQVRTGSTHGIENEVQKLDRAQWQKLRELGVEDAPAVAPNAVSTLGSLFPGPAGTDAYKHESMAKHYADDEPVSLEERAEIDAYDERIRGLQERFPDEGLMTTADMWLNVKEGAKRAEENMSIKRSKRGQVGMFLGGAVASMNPDSDPLNFITLGVGGGGKTAAQRIAGQAGAQGVIEGLNQVTGVQAQRDLLGLESGLKDGLIRTGFAMVGGAGLQGLGEAAGAGYRRLFRPAPGDPTPPPSILGDTTPPVRPDAPTGRSVRPEGLNSAAAPVPRIARSPDAVAAMALEASPHGARAGSTRTEDDLLVVAEQLDNWEGPPPSQIQPTRAGAKSGAPVIDIAREIDPVAFRRVETAAAKIDEVSNALRENSDIPNRTVSSLEKVLQELKEGDEVINAREGVPGSRKSIDQKAKRIKVQDRLNKLLKRAEDKLPADAYADLIRYVDLTRTLSEYTPLVERAVRRAKGEWDTPVARGAEGGEAKVRQSEEPSVSRSPDEPIFEAAVDKRISALKEQQVRLDKAMQVYRDALGGAVGKGGKVDFAGRKMDIDKEKILVPGGDGEVEISIRELLEDNYKAEQELEAVSSCSIK